MSFAALRNKSTNLSKLVEQAKETSGTTRQSEDPRFWQPTRDKAGNGYAVIRFLPGYAEAATPWVRYWDHAFKGPTGQWYIEKSLTSIGQQDPLSELNSKMWNSGVESDKAIVRQRKRNLKYIANVLVISDPAAPENEGQVKLFRFGKKIFDKIMDKARPTFEEDEPVNVFDLWEGADFKLRQKKVEGYPNYDQSVFEGKSAIYGGDEDKILKVVNSQHKLSEFLDRKNFKSYEELSRKLAMVLNTEEKVTKSQHSSDEDMDEVPQVQEVKKAAPQVKISKRVEEDDDDDAVSFFQKLAAEA